MALGTAPSREDIYSELFESTYRDSGGANSLKDMHNYIFGSTNYSRSAFANKGIPELSSLTATGLEQTGGEIEVEFNVDNTGGIGAVTFVAQYWEETQDVNPSPYYEIELGSDTGTGIKTFTISQNISNGTTYEVRVTGYNAFNNNGSYPPPRGDTASWDWTNEGTATPTNPQLTKPTLTGQTVEHQSSKIYINFDYSDNEDNFVVQYRLDSGNAQQTNEDCNSNVGTASNPKEIISDMAGTLPSGETVEVRVKAQATGYLDSPYSNWVTSTSSIIPSCPL